MPMLDWSTHAHEYQQRGAEHLFGRDAAALWLSPGYGKAQEINSLVYTPHGWQRIGDIQPGDEVYGHHGRAVKVLEVFPQVDRRVLRVTFNDGTSTLAGPDHLWRVADSTYAAKAPVAQIANHKGGRGGVTGWQTLTTQEILDHGLFRPSQEGRRGAYWRVPVAAAVQHPAADLPIPPYTLGALIGDGYLVGRSGLVLSVPPAKDSVRRRVTRETPETPWHYESPSDACPRIRAPNGPLRANIAALGLAVKSGERFIPETYKRASVEQRTALLHGLMDTDGCAAKNRITFHTTSERLCRDVAELVRSLGGVAKVRYYDRAASNKTPEWQVGVKTTFCPCPRQADQWHPHKLAKIITTIEPVEDAETVCILVDDPDHLYLTDDFIVTHNTSITLHAFKAMKDAGMAQNMLIVAPLRVIQTVWEQEIEQWASLCGLRAARLHGAKKDKWLRRRDVNVWLINYEGLPWLVDLAKKGKLPVTFDVMVFDEIRRMKNSQGIRFKAARPFAALAKYRWGLTGTPASNGLMDLFGQFLILDNGKALGQRITRFRHEFFEQGYDGFSWVPRPGAQDAIETRIGPMVFRADGMLDLPDFIYDNRVITLDAKARKIYDTLKRDLITELGGTKITAANAAVLVGKLKQMANGRVYDENHAVHEIHSQERGAAGAGRGARRRAANYRLRVQPRSRADP
jgi:hypothetical protein